MWRAFQRILAPAAVSRRKLDQKSAAERPALKEALHSRKQQVKLPFPDSQGCSQVYKSNCCFLAHPTVRALSAHSTSGSEARLEFRVSPRLPQTCHQDGCLLSAKREMRSLYIWWNFNICLRPNLDKRPAALPALALSAHWCFPSSLLLLFVWISSNFISMLFAL